MTAAGVTRLAQPERPFPGIGSYTFRDRNVFFGRRGDVRRLAQLVTVYRAVLLFGDSGTGKSSLINAGLLPAAGLEGFAPERVRVAPHPGQEFVVERVEADATDKQRYLPSVFATDDRQSPIIVAADALPAALAGLPDDVYPLLIFDQFEELITQFEDSVPHHREARLAVVAAISKIIGLQDLRVKVVLSFREDYLAKVVALFSDVHDLDQHHLRVRPPQADPEILHELLRGPFTRPGIEFERDIDEDLAAAVAEGFADRTRGGTVSLTELQIVATSLWLHPEPAVWFADKGIDGILAAYYSEALDKLGDDIEYAAVAVLGRLVTESGLRNVVSEEDLIARVVAEETIAKKKVKRALMELTDKARLVARERRHEVVFYEIVSEFLVPWIQAETKRRVLRQDLTDFGSDYLREIESEVLHAWRKEALWRRGGFALVGAAALAGLVLGALWLVFRPSLSVGTLFGGLWLAFIAVGNGWVQLEARAKRESRKAAEYLELHEEVAQSLVDAQGKTREEIERVGDHLRERLEPRLRLPRP